MRFQPQNRSSVMQLAIFLAVTLPILLAVPGAAQAKPEAKTQLSAVNLVTGPTNVDVVGLGWKLHYQSPSNLSEPEHVRARMAVAENGTAWFSHGGWLRLIDVRKGVVLGRWHFTDSIIGLEPQGDAVEVEYKIDGGNRRWVTKKAVVSSQTKKVDFVNPSSFLYLRFATTEAERFETRFATTEAERMREFRFFDVLKDPAKARERARKLLPEYEEMARRDPTSTFIQAAYGGFLKDVGDPRAGGVLRTATMVESSDFTELWTLSTYLDAIGEPALAREAFERGYRDYLERGNDPRMFHVLIGRLILYRLPRQGNQTPSVRKEIMERLYRIAPNTEGADLAWALYARELETQGDASAGLWRERTAQSAREELVLWPLPKIDWAFLFCVGGLLGSLLFLVVQWVRYSSQRRLDAAKGTNPTFAGRAIRGFSYWSRRERYAMATMVAISWYSLGLMAIFSVGMLRIASTPINAWMGSLASPQAREHLQKLPETSGRNFLLALSHQQAGDAETALRTYLGQPQYAQAWNNLGVIYRAKGEEAKAREAFAKALQVDSGLNEAKLNLGQPTTDLWTSQYRSYFPGKTMLAPPTGEQAREAYMGTSRAGVYLRATAGPLMGLPRGLAAMSGEVRLPIPFLFLGAVLFGLTLVLLFILPYREVTEAPSRWLGWLEALAPGSSRAWGWFGGVALASWGALLISLLSLATTGSPLFFASIWLPNIARAFNVATTPRELMMLLLGWGAYLWILPAAFFVLNLVFFVRERKRGAR